MCSGAVRIRPTPFPGGKSRTKSGHRLLCYLGQFFLFLVVCFGHVWCFVSLFLVVGTSAINCQRRLVSEDCCVLSGTLNRAHSFTHCDAAESHTDDVLSLCSLSVLYSNK